MSLALLFHYLMLNTFRMLIHPSSGTGDLFVELFHGLCCSGSMCVGVTLWFGCGGVVSVCGLKHHTTNVVIQQNSRKLLLMDILMSETCWAHKKWNKTANDIKLVFYSSTSFMPLNVGYYCVWMTRGHCTVRIYVHCRYIGQQVFTVLVFSSFSKSMSASSTLCLSVAAWPTVRVSHFRYTHVTVRLQHGN